MTAQKKLLELVPTIQAAKLLKENVKKKTNVVSQGVKNILGINLIKISADSIALLD